MEIHSIFGRAPYFLVVDSETFAFEALDNEENLNALKGAGIQVHAWHTTRDQGSFVTQAEYQALALTPPALHIEPDENILNFSHACIPVSPDNSHYGRNGDYKDFRLPFAC